MSNEWLLLIRDMDLVWLLEEGMAVVDQRHGPCVAVRRVRMAVGDQRHGPGVAVRRVRDGCW